MAKALISSMDRAFEPELYHDEYQARLRELIEQKIQGREIVASASEKPSNVINLMEALQASIQHLQEDSPTPPKKKRTSRKKAETA